MKTGAGTLPPLFSCRALAALILPLVVEQTFAALMGMVDTLMVSTLGEAAISGVSSVDMLNILILFVFEAFGVGGNVVCAQYIGKGDQRAVAGLVKQFLLLQAAVAALLTVPTGLFAKALLHLLYSAAEPEVLSAAVVYLRITALSYPFVAIYTASAALYRAVGRPKIPVLIVAFGNTLNVFGNAVFIFRFHMGVAGAALATFLARVFCCLTLLFYQMKPNQMISIDSGEKWRIRPSEMLKIIRVGVPNAIENGVFQLGKVFVQAVVVTLGTTVIAAQAIIVQIETVSLRPSIAIGSAMLTVVGQYIGAGRKKEARRYTLLFTALSVLSCILLASVTILVTPNICELIELSAKGKELVCSIMVFICICRMFIWPPAFTLPNGFRAAGDVAFPMRVSILSMWVFRVLTAFLLCRFTSAGLWGIWIGWVLDWFFRAIIFIGRFIRGNWLERTAI